MSEEVDYRRAAAVLLGHHQSPILEVAKLLARRDALESELAQLRERQSESFCLIERLNDLLDGTANALKGEPPPLLQHSFHDLPELAAQLWEEREALLNCRGGLLRISHMIDGGGKWDAVDAAVMHEIAEAHLACLPDSLKQEA